MIVDRPWVERNLGFDPISTPAPESTFKFQPAAKPGSVPEDLQREIIDFDSEGPEGMAFFAFSSATGLSRFTDIPWPKGLTPKTGDKPRGRSDSQLPRADALIVTWTVDEGHALSRVLTPGRDSHDNYVPYTRNYAKIARKMRKDCPALEAQRLGAYWTTAIAGKKVVVFKSESHLSQDTRKHPKNGGTLPNEDVWEQIITEVKPRLVITTGTAGGIGKQFEVGDVVVSPIVKFDCRRWLKSEQFHDASYHNGKLLTKYFATAETLFKVNAGQLPKDNHRLPKIVRVSRKGLSSSVVTTDFFGFDTSNNYFKLQGLGDVSEMGDAVLGIVTQKMGAAAPSWVAVRNVSDPQIKAAGTIKDQAKIAAQIYKGYGRWSTVCSALVCWAIVAAL